ncbi:MAG: type II toxin-antitoxin system RelE/ParE family toxin [Pseudomonadota bacterium]
MYELKRLPAAFYATPQGREPVREWLKELLEADRRIVGQDIATAEYGWPVGMPLSRSLGDGLFEIRSDITDGRTARVLFAVVDNTMVLLHSFVKKTQKTPKTDLELAKRRLKEIR